MRQVSLKHAELSDISTEVLERGGLFCFKAHGSSMYPFIQDGDVLTVHHVEINTLKVGDVAFYRVTKDRVVAHRVVGKISKNGQLVFIMRGDSGFKTNEQVPADYVIGKVMSIQRGQKVMQTDRSFWKVAASLWITFYPLGALLLRTKSKSKKGASFFLRQVHALKPYRVIARRLIEKRIRYSIATDDDISGLSKFFRYENLSNNADTIKLSEKAFSGLEGDGHMLVARLRGKIVGATEITRFTDDEITYTDWWIFGMRVRIPHRGMGIGEGLVRRAIEKASEEGARRLNLLVYEKNEAAVNLYHKMGFHQISITALDQELEEEAKQANQRRIILSKEI